MGEDSESSHDANKTHLLLATALKRLGKHSEAVSTYRTILDEKGQADGRNNGAPVELARFNLALALIEETMMKQEEGREGTEGAEEAIGLLKGITEPTPRVKLALGNALRVCNELGSTIDSYREARAMLDRSDGQEDE